MGRMKDWAMDMEGAVATAVESGAKCVGDVDAYVKTVMPGYDKKFVEKTAIEILGECGDSPDG